MNVKERRPTPVFCHQVSMPSFPVVVKIGHAHSGIGKVWEYSSLALLFWHTGAHTCLSSASR